MKKISDSCLYPVACIVLAGIPILLFGFAVTFLFSEEQIGRIWLSDLCGSAFAFLTPLTCVLIFVMRHRDAAFKVIYPRCYHLISALLAFDVPLLFVSLLMNCMLLTYLIA